MKTSNVSFGNLLEQLSEDKINRVVDRNAVRAGWLDQLGLSGGSSGDSSGSGSSHHNSGSGSSDANDGGTGGIVICL